MIEVPELGTSEEICKSCSEEFEFCLECNKDNCTKCEDGMSLSGGRCHDCSQFSNSLTCNEEGPLSCQTGYYLLDNECHLCMDALDYCLECTDS